MIKVADKFEAKRIPKAATANDIVLFIEQPLIDGMLGLERKKASSIG